MASCFIDSSGSSIVTSLTVLRGVRRQVEKDHLSCLSHDLSGFGCFLSGNTDFASATGHIQDLNVSSLQCSPSLSQPGHPGRPRCSLAAASPS